VKLPAVCIAMAFAAGVALGMFSLLRNYSVSAVSVRILSLLVFCPLGFAFFPGTTTRSNLLRCIQATESPFWRKPACHKLSAMKGPLLVAPI